MKATNTVLFVHGAGDEGFEADKPMAASLKSALGNQYEVNSPKINSDESLPDFGWPAQIGEHISAISGELILVGHSLGASMLLKYLSEYPVSKKINGLFLMATSFWGGDEEWKSGLKLKDNFANFLPAEIPVFLYHSQEDEVVPFSHLLRYSQHLPQAVVRELKRGGHQFGNDLTSVAKDIKSLK